MKTSFLLPVLLGASSLFASDLSDALMSGSLWTKSRSEICSTDFVGLRYMPIDDHTIRLTPRLNVKFDEKEYESYLDGKQINHKKRNKGAGLNDKSDLCIDDVDLGETIVRWDEHMNTLNMLGLVYSRGDDGEITKEEFAKLIRKTVKTLDALAVKAGCISESKGKGEEEHVGLAGLYNWYWEWDGGVMLLEASASDMGRGNVRPEFIRLKMGPTPESIATGGADNMTNSAWLLKNVKKEGAKVYVAGIPMVDQGQKGYCVVASVARIFAYYGADAIDQHTLAQLCDTLTVGGTYVHEMENALTNMGNQFHFTPMCIKAYYSENQSGISASQLVNLVKMYVDKGVPVLWTVTDPRHMRMLIGYNTATNEVYYTDSWGQGHEMKPMSAKKAAKLTSTMHVLIPHQ